MELKKLNNATVSRKTRPVRVLQFGDGNFLRAFVDWMIDIADEKGILDTDVAIVSPRFSAGRGFATLQAQDGMYNVILEGIQDGKPKRETRLITCVGALIASADDYAKYMEHVLSPDLRFVVSNTTEAGIRYEADEVMTDLPVTFPGKVTNMLFKRWKHFSGDPSKGLIFLCCELIENNSTTLREYVLRHAEEAGLPEDFRRWVSDHNIFVDTLVDRIVPGFPRDTIDEVKAELGYDDNAVVKGELYHLWAIGGDGWETVREEFPLDKCGLHVVYMPSIKEFRDKKVRILNGSHTAMVPVALQLGCETVMDAFNTPAVNAFINGMVADEVLPMIEGDPAALKAFADSILERFYNPFIKHYLKSIALNSLSKWEARNYPSCKDFYERTGELPARETFAFAALLSLYGPESGFTPEDDAEHLAKINAAWNPCDWKATVHAILGSGIFIEDFDQAIPGFADLAAVYLEDIRTNGMKAALDKVLEN